MVKGKKGPGPLSSEEDEEPPLPNPDTLIPNLPLTPASGIAEPPIDGEIDEESPQFRAALDRRIAQIQLLKDESPIIDNPLGLIDIAPRVDLPLGNQSSSRSTEIRAISLNLRPSSPVPSDDETSSRSSKISSRLDNGGNPCKIFSRESSITTTKGRMDSNNNDNDKMESTPREAAFWDKDSSSSNDEPSNKYSKKKPCEKMAKRIHYQRSSTVLLSEITKYVIDINTPDKFHHLRMLHSVLPTTGLLTLIEGHRTEPIMTEINTHGFSNSETILIPRVEYEDEKLIDSMSSEPIIERVDLEEDDAFYHIHDNDRLFSLVYIMFSKILHHNISIRNQKLRNEIES